LRVNETSLKARGLPTLPSLFPQVKKAKVAEKYGADTITDLSMGGPIGGDRAREIHTHIESKSYSMCGRYCAIAIMEDYLKWRSAIK
jgi:thiamine biosynthesis protein ThiC